MPGALVRETWTEGERTLSATGQVLMVDAPRRLTFEWTEPGWSTSLRVEITVAETTGGSRVVIEEHAFTRLGADTDLRLEHEEGWRHHLVRLSEACLDGTGPQRSERNDPDR